MLRSVILFCLSTSLCYAEESSKKVAFDCYTATPATEEQISHYESINQLKNCVASIELPCDPNDWRRSDASCNNLKYPSRGTYFNPLYRMLPAQFHDGYHARKSVSGKDLRRPRQVRLNLLTTGKSVHPEFTMNVPAWGVFMNGDIGSVHDIENLLVHHPNCCQKEHINDYSCAPNIIDEDDPWHRFDGLTCMNMTRPLYYQDYGCTADAVPSPIAQATAVYDLSLIYNMYNQGDQPMRSFVKGQFTFEVENGRIWPPNGPTASCLLNQKDETRCMKWQKNVVLPANLFMIWFFRLHNYVAGKLADVNPCWDDDTIFKAAREICIAWSQQMLMHEWLGVLIGRDNLLDSGLVGRTHRCREIYDDKCYPKVSVEFTFAMRWFHIIQEAKGKMFDTNGNVVGQFPLVNATLRTGLLAKDNNLEYFTQGSFRQPSSDFDSGVDYDISEQGLGPLQRAMDLTTSDLHKNRLFGLAPYVDYIYKCRSIRIKSFDDFVKYKIIPAKKVALLKEMYEDPKDVDIIAGLWIENVIKGGNIPQTLACIIIDHFSQAQKCDRHYYDRCKRPHAFTNDQLYEISKLNLAQLLCAVGDGVTEVQPNAFLQISPKNPLTPCSKLPKIDYDVFADRACKKNKW
ncbi:peroxidase-like [Anticarsia gemmatalis]|uniref:peroxidase-like n=1 Tax=Anticarsia gemmatalis TaxID=129554 RepID=UPI003F767F46